MRKIDLPSLTNEKMDYLYNCKKASAVEMASMHNVSVGVIYRRMEDAGIKRRSASEIHKLTHIGGSTASPPTTDPSTKYGITKDELEKLYHDKDTTLTQISMIYGVAISTVGGWIYKYGIKRRNRSECSRLAHTGPTPKHDFTKEELEKLYYGKNLTLLQIGAIYGVDSTTIARWMDKHGLDRRPKSETNRGRQSFLGKKHSEKTKQKMREKAIKRWGNPEYIMNVMKGLHAEPNKLELKVDRILQNRFPGDWGYNGDFGRGVAIGGMIPDFVNVNGKKVVIEVFGEPWHDPNNTFLDGIDWQRTELGRTTIYAQLGYRCIVFWEHDLKGDNAEDFVINTILGESIQ